MQELKKYLEVSKEAINETIVLVQKEIDELYEERLNNESLNPFYSKELSNKIEVKNQRKFHQYGWLGAVESVLKKIEELERQDELEFEAALDQLDITERELKADA